jgi:hypothetical protein
MGSPTAISMIFASDPDNPHRSRLPHAVLSKAPQRTFQLRVPSMVKQEDEHAKQDKNECPNNAEYDVALSEFSIRFDIANGLLGFFI